MCFVKCSIRNSSKTLKALFIIYKTQLHAPTDHHPTFSVKQNVSGVYRHLSVTGTF